MIGDPVRLRRNADLGGNAVKFTEQGAVTVQVRLLDTNLERVRLEICVKDSGIGIPRDRLDLLFRPFYQIDASNSRQFGGTGLGLAISREIVSGGRRHHGAERRRMRIGFTFTATLASVPSQNAGPAGLWLSMDASSADASAGAGLCDGNDSAPMRVLLAEDNCSQSGGCCRTPPKKLGCSVRVVPDGGERSRR